MRELRILGIYVSERVKDAGMIQSILSRYGCSIRTRLGLHALDDVYAGDNGLILLELTGDAEESLRLENELLEVEGIDVKKMIFLR